MTRKAAIKRNISAKKSGAFAQGPRYGGKDGGIEGLMGRYGPKKPRRSQISQNLRAKGKTSRKYL